MKRQRMRRKNEKKIQQFWIENEMWYAQWGNVYSLYGKRERENRIVLNLLQWDMSSLMESYGTAPNTRTNNTHTHRHPKKKHLPATKRWTFAWQCIKSWLLTKFNLWNVLAAVSFIFKSELKFDDISRCLEVFFLFCREGENGYRAAHR